MLGFPGGDIGFGCEELCRSELFSSTFFLLSVAVSDGNSSSSTSSFSDMWSLFLDDFVAGGVVVRVLVFSSEVFGGSSEVLAGV